MFKKYFTMSFDDGIEQDKRLIELMKQYNLKGTFNLNGGLFGQKDYVARIGDIGFMDVPVNARIRPKIFKQNEHFRLPLDEIKQVYDGFEVATHAYKHEPLARMKAKQVMTSLEKDIKTLSEVVGYQVKGHAYPGGMSSKVAAACLKEQGLVYGREAFTNGQFTFPIDPYRYKPTCSHKDKNIVEILNQFITAKPVDEDLLFSMWGHSYEFDYNTDRCSWKHIEKVFEVIAGHSDIVYCTNIAAFESHHKK